jgi:hypothetical protein
LKFTLLFTGNDRAKVLAGKFCAGVEVKFGIILFRGMFEGTASAWRGDKTELAEVIVCERFGRE